MTISHPMTHRSTNGLSTNAHALEAIRAVVAGGGSSNMRILGIQEPLVVARAAGCRLWDVEGNELLDLNMGYGPHLFGYADRDVLDEIADQFTRGHMTGLPHYLDHEAGELIAELIPSVEQVRFANSGTEAVASAVRLARATTGRSLVLTFEGHYHGWSETLLRKLPTDNGHGDPTPWDAAPGAPGMIPEALRHTLQLPWNDFAALDDAFARYGDRVAAVILEPICANAGVILPVEGFLARVAALTARHGAKLVFDEVITGFRVAPGGAQQLLGITPDLTVVSKALGGGFPVAAFGGSRETMLPLARNQAFHAGVYAGNHAAARAVVSTLGKIRRNPTLYALLEQTTAWLEQRLRETFAIAEQPVLIARAGSVVSVALATRPIHAVENCRAALSVVDFEAHKRFQLLCQRRGVYFHPNPFEPWFLSVAHGREEVDEAVEVIADALACL